MDDDLDVPKTCARCGQVLPLRDFPLRRKDGTKRFGHCRASKAAYQKQWYERNRDRHIGNVNTLRKERRGKNKQLVVAAKSVPCADCGERYPPYVMDFDHVRGVKVGDIGALKMHVPTDVLREEIAKCDVVCANCHRIRTHKRRQVF